MSSDVDFTATNHYELLGVDPSEETVEIEQQVKQYRNTYHPDSNPDSNTKKFTRINKAIDVLTDVEKREEYDTNATRLSIEVESSDVKTGDDIELTVDNDDGKRLQYTIVTDEREVLTDGNGEVTVSFESPGEKQVTAQKVDTGTQKYIDAETTVFVSEEQTVPLEVRVYSESGELLTNPDDVLTVTEHGLITVHNGDTGEAVNDVRVIIDDFVKETSDNSVSFIPEEAKTYSITCEKQGAEGVSYVPVTDTVQVRPERKSIGLEVLTDDVKSKTNIQVRTTLDGSIENGVSVTISDVDTVSEGTTSGDGTTTIYIPDEGTYTLTARKDSEETSKELYEPGSVTVTATGINDEVNTTVNDGKKSNEERYTNSSTASMSSTVQNTNPTDTTVETGTELSPVELTSAYTQTKQWTKKRGVGDVLYTNRPRGYLTKFLSIIMYFSVIYGYGEWISVNDAEMTAVVSTVLTVSFLIAVVLPLVIPRIGGFIFGFYTILDVQEKTVFYGYTAWELVMGSLTVLSIILWYRYVYKQYPYKD